jgi:hypothetical protein
MLREIAPDLWVAEQPLRYLGFPGHGEIVETGGREELRRDLAWLLR